MSSLYDDYEVIEPRRHHKHHHRDRDVIRETVRDDRTPRYTTVEETYVKKGSPAPAVASDAPYVSRQTELIRRPVREDSDLSIEEVRREFPPPGSADVYYRGNVDDRRGSSRRARSVEREDSYDGYGRRSRGDMDDRRSRPQNLVVEERTARHRSLSRNQKIIAAVSGAALAVGGKELWDRRQAHGAPHERNVLGTAALGAAGAFAAYEGAELYAKHGKHGDEKEKVKTYAAVKDKDGRDAEVYYSSEEEVKPQKKSRRKSLVEGALGLVGAGAAAKSLGIGGDRDGRHGRDNDNYDSRSRSRTRGKSEQGAKIQQAAKAALLAGAVEAFRVRKEPGGWGGAKAQRILTAAIGSGAVDAVADRNPDKHSKRHIIESVIGGLAANRAVNGSRNEIEDDGGSGRGGRSRSRSRARSRSRSRGGGGAGGSLAALATAAAAGLAGKKLLDNRSRSRSRRRRSPSRDSYDSRSPSPRRERHKRSKSVSDYARKGLAAIGLGEAAENGRDRRSRDVEDSRVVRKTRYSGDSDSDYDRRSRRGGNRGDPYGDSKYADSRSTLGGGGGRKQKDGRKNRRVAEGKGSDDGSSSDLGSSSGDEKAKKKMKGKQLLTAGLATVATIHAAHNVYASMEKRKARKKAVEEGEMSPEEAKKLKTKATLQDVASVGIAALGIKGAISEWKEMQEMRHEYAEFCEKKDERHKKRLERLSKTQKSNGGGRRRADNWQGGYPQGPQYVDSNPYSALPPPPAPNYAYGDR